LSINDLIDDSSVKYDTLEKSSIINLGSAEVITYGRVHEVRFSNITFNQELAVGTGVTLATLPSNLKPAQNIEHEIMIRNGVSADFYIDKTSGDIMITPRSIISVGQACAIIEFYIK